MKIKLQTINKNLNASEQLIYTRSTGLCPSFAVHNFLHLSCYTVSLINVQCYSDQYCHCCFWFILSLVPSIVFFSSNKTDWVELTCDNKSLLLRQFKNLWSSTTILRKYSSQFFLYSSDSDYSRITECELYSKSLTYRDILILSVFRHPPGPVFCWWKSRSAPDDVRLVPRAEHG